MSNGRLSILRVGAPTLPSPRGGGNYQPVPCVVGESERDATKTLSAGAANRARRSHRRKWCRRGCRVGRPDRSRNRKRVDWYRAADDADIDQLDVVEYSGEHLQAG